MQVARSCYNCTCIMQVLVGRYIKLQALKEMGVGMFTKRLMVLASLCVALIVTLLVALAWYNGGSKPLTSQEIERYIAIIEQQPKNPGGRHDIAALRDFLQKDDGQPFYTVNLYQYHEQAQYFQSQGEGHEQGLDMSGRAAFDRFSTVMVGLLAQHASHPIFGGTSLGGEWDRLVIVRYRSRRDIVAIFASDEFALASKDKWAGLAKNQRLLVQGLHIPEFNTVLGAAFVTLLVSMLMLFLLWFMRVRLPLRKKKTH